MIIRILGEGQYDAADLDHSALQSHDDAVEKAVGAGDEQAAHAALAELHAFILAHAVPVAADYLGPSDAIVPGEDATIAEITDMLTGEGFIPDAV